MRTQVLLETLFDKLKAQSDALTLFSSHVNGLHVGADLEERLLFLESRFDAVFGIPGTEAKLSPFKQEEILGRLQAVEGQMTAQADDLQDLHSLTHQARFSQLC